jgi:hypothetical protein
LLLLLLLEGRAGVDWETAYKVMHPLPLYKSVPLSPFFSSTTSYVSLSLSVSFFRLNHLLYRKIVGVCIENHKNLQMYVVGRM